jgi:hypothetical protein
MSGCECKPGAKRKRDSAQPQKRAQPVTRCKEMLRLGCCYRTMPAGSVRQVKAQQSPDLAVEIHFASLNTRRKHCALGDFENPSRQTQAV